MIAKTVKDFYQPTLESIRILKVNGYSFFVNYNPSDGFLMNLGEMFNYFHLRENEMIIFTMEEDNIYMYARVYQQDGLEIDYYNRTLNNAIYPSSESFWKFDWCTGIGMTFKLSLCFSSLYLY